MVGTEGIKLVILALRAVSGLCAPVADTLIALAPYCPPRCIRPHGIAKHVS